MKANCSYNSRELWAVLCVFEHGKMRQFPGEKKTLSFVTRKCMWKKHGSMPEECMWIGALGEYPGPSPLLKDEACRTQRGQITYARSQSEFVSRPRAHPGLMFFFNPVVLHCPKIVGNAWTKKVLFLQLFFFFIWHFWTLRRCVEKIGYPIPTPPWH